MMARMVAKPFVGQLTDPFRPWGTWWGVFNSFGADVSADGGVVVGIGSSISDEAFRWTQATGIIGLGDLAGGRTESTALGISSDGSVVVGYGFGNGDRQEAYRWTAATGMVGLGFLTHGITSSAATAVSADGSTVVGNNGLPPSPGSTRQQLEAVRWTQATGMVGDFGDLPGGVIHSQANDVSADGSVVVGYGTDNDLAVKAFWWRQDIGMVDLQDLLVSLAHRTSTAGSSVKHEASLTTGVLS